MKRIIFDSGPIITLALNNLLWLPEKIKQDQDIEFFITKSVKKELIDNPINSKKFKFEALQVLSLINKGIIRIYDNDKIDEETKYLLHLANNSFLAGNNPLHLVHFAEMSAITASLDMKADAIMIDERTTRYLIERPDKLKNVLQHKLHTKVTINRKLLSELRQKTKAIKFIRSAEFVTIAFEKGMLNDYLPQFEQPKKTLLEALLWGIKLNGCAISTKDLEKIIALERKIWQKA